MNLSQHLSVLTLFPILGQERVLHQTPIKAHVAAIAAAKASHSRLRNYTVPSAVPFMKRAHRRCEAQLIPGSGEGQNTPKAYD